MVRHRLKNDNSIDKTLTWSLYIESNGDLYLECKDNEGNPWNVLSITSEGFLYCCGGIPNDIGLEVNDYGCIVKSQ